MERIDGYFSYHNMSYIGLMRLQKNRTYRRFWPNYGDRTKCAKFLTYYRKTRYLWSMTGLMNTCFPDQRYSTPDAEILYKGWICNLISLTALRKNLPKMADPVAQSFGYVLFGVLFTTACGSFHSNFLSLWHSRFWQWLWSHFLANILVYVPV